MQNNLKSHLKQENRRT